MGSPQRGGNSIGFAIPIDSEKPIHLAQGHFPELEDRCETAQFDGDAA
jgi:hypothetical protein